MFGRILHLTGSFFICVNRRNLWIEMFYWFSEEHSMTEATIVPQPKKSVALSGTVAGTTAVCTVGRTGNDLNYRGYDILDFAETAEFEEVAYLLVHEKLPTAAELAGYKTKLKSLRGLPAQVKAALEQVPASAHPMDVMRTAV